MEFWRTTEWRHLAGMIKQNCDGKFWAPRKEDVLRAFVLCPLQKTKVVVIGQDPYDTPSVADGLAFSCRGIAYQPSLRNIFKELREDLGLIGWPKTGDLSPWAAQGVLLINTALTVRVNQPNSHRDIGWDDLVGEVLLSVSEVNPDAVFILWGQNAQKLASEYKLQSAYNCIESAHPSPLAAHRGFFGSRPFSKTNKMLKESGQGEIDWMLPMKFGENHG